MTREELLVVGNRISHETWDNNEYYDIIEVSYNHVTMRSKGGYTNRYHNSGFGRPPQWDRWRIISGPVKKKKEPSGFQKFIRSHGL